MDLRVKFLGTILGCAVGDALGAPYEGRSRNFMLKIRELTSKYEKIPGYPLGQYTDDTQMTIKLAESLIEKGAVDGEDIARKYSSLWRDNTIIGGGVACRTAMMNIIVHEKKWDEAGAEEGRAGNGTAMRASPIGLFDFKKLHALRRDSITQSIITHTDKRASAGAVAVSASVYYNINNEKIEPNSFIDFVLENIAGINDEFSAAINELKEIITFDEDSAFLKIASYGFDSDAVPVGITPYVVPTVMAALYNFLRYSDDWAKSVSGALRFGGDTDTTAAITGAISGSRNGYGAIPETLIESLKDHEYITGIAEKLYEICSRGE